MNESLYTITVMHSKWGREMAIHAPEGWIILKVTPDVELPVVYKLLAHGAADILQAIDECLAVGHSIFSVLLRKTMS
ncbi:MAG: hypothetical protein ACJAS1_005647 [Oleiphilaceae bacterium]|jgi:hypothetical protein